MADWFSSRVPLHPEDVRKYRGDYQDSLDSVADIESAMRAQDLARLRLIAAGKREAERAMGSGPVDQELSYRIGGRVADAYGATGRSPGLMLGKSIAELSAWAASNPESRNVFHQAAIIPEQAIMHASEALSGDKPRLERVQRLAMAIPAAVFPDLGYPAEPAYERMYATNPLMALAIDYAMPGLDAVPGSKLFDRAMYGLGSRTHLVDKAGNEIRRLRNSPKSFPIALPVR